MKYLPIIILRSDFLEKYEVILVENNNKEVLDLVVNKHYAGRKPSISYAFLVKRMGIVLGAITYGKPASPYLCNGVCGKSFSKYVYELNRVVFLSSGEKNLVSWSLARTEKILKNLGNFVIVSYSDTGMNHNGYIYQASNYIYTGKTKERTDKYAPPGKHSRWYTQGNSHLRKVRTSKHRYVKFVGNKGFKKEARSALKYEDVAYPKERSVKYTLGDKMLTKILNKNTGEYFFE